MSPRWGYVQARAQARYAVLADAALWRQLEPARDLASYLAEARGTVLGPWLMGLTPASEPAEIEQLLAERLVGLIQDSAGWLDVSWGPGLEWIRLLVRLPEIEAARREGRGIVEGAERLLDHFAQGETTLKQAWCAGWRERIPPLSRRAARAMDDLAATLFDHSERFPQLEVRDAWRERAQLDHRLRWLFRRATLQPAVVFCLLALVALQLERLRAALLMRSVFSQVEATEA